MTTNQPLRIGWWWWNPDSQKPERLNEAEDFEAALAALCAGPYDPVYAWTEEMAGEKLAKEMSK